MPFVSVSASVPMSDEKKDVLQREIGNLISIIPGKNIDNTMTKLEGGCDIFMAGSPRKAVFCEIRLLGEAPQENKAELYGKLKDLFFDQLGIETLYLNFNVFSEWGSADAYRVL